MHVIFFVPLLSNSGHFSVEEKKVCTGFSYLWTWNMKSFMAENRKEMEQIKGLDVTQVCEKMHQSDVMLLELQLHKKDMAG